MKISFHIILLVSLISLSVTNTHAQQVTPNQLAKALSTCQKDLSACTLKVDSLRKALKQTQSLWEMRKAYTDSLTANLKTQLSPQDSISFLMRANSDTLGLMVKNYERKIDEVNRLYIKELRRQSRPWFLTKRGLKGFFYGVFVGGALGLAFAVLD